MSPGGGATHPPALADADRVGGCQGLGGGLGRALERWGWLFRELGMTRGWSHRALCP